MFPSLDGLAGHRVHARSGIGSCPSCFHTCTTDCSSHLQMHRIPASQTWPAHAKPGSCPPLQPPPTTPRHVLLVTWLVRCLRRLALISDGQIQGPFLAFQSCDRGSSLIHSSPWLLRFSVPAVAAVGPRSRTTREIVPETRLLCADAHISNQALRYPKTPRQAPDKQ